MIKFFWYCGENSKFSHKHSLVLFIINLHIFQVFYKSFLFVKKSFFFSSHRTNFPREKWTSEFSRNTEWKIFFSTLKAPRPVRLSTDKKFSLVLRDWKVPCVLLLLRGYFSQTLAKKADNFTMLFHIKILNCFDLKFLNFVEFILIKLLIVPTSRYLEKSYLLN